MRKTGALVGSATFALPAGSRVSRLLSDLVPASTADDGFVFVRTTNGIGINATQVFFSRDLRVISNVAPLNVDPAAGFQPPAQ
jgi:hypothetical protein